MRATSDSSVLVGARRLVCGRVVRRTYRAEALDKYGNAIKDVTSTTTFKISPNGSCLKNLCTSSKLGLHLVIATRGNLGGLAVLKVT